MGLSSLALWTIFDEAAAAFLTALSTPKNSIKTLRLRGATTESSITLGPAVNDIGPHLHTLVLDSFNPLIGRTNRYVDIFPTLRSLQSFSWNGYKPAYPLEALDVKNLRTILDAFPSPATVTHLSIGTDDLSSLEHIMPLLGHPTLTLLTKLDLPSPLSVAPAEEASNVAAMAKACEDRGIQWSMGGVAQWT